MEEPFDNCGRTLHQHVEITVGRERDKEIRVGDY